MDEMSYCSFSGGEEYKNHFQPGVYVCSECGHELFSSTSKFEHSSPWPAFSETIHEDSVTKHPEAWGPLKRRLMDRMVSSEREGGFLLLMVQTVDEALWDKS
ncbi:Methionine-R-sulfoxide reductase B1-A [Nibea albiflora]|uniref:Methionine-R-sulfoxide reductase B1-A n=1 Tax=Nibea albiflora TaxID=240163 RepID=A0ACB7EXY0_NIBAL|nr:Methionine-R-sulfoxide reductase B1-A [Nibea albiflora]